MFAYDDWMTESASNILRREFSVCIEIPIAWGDMDAFQHVNNLTYIRHFESSRIAYFERIGFLEEMEKSGTGPILASVKCNFRAPLTYPDLVLVGACVKDVEVDRFTVTHRIVSQKLDRVVADGEDLIVTFDYHQEQKVPIPNPIKEAIKNLEKGS